jgi:flagellum-specific ATP synthase
MTPATITDIEARIAARIAACPRPQQRGRVTGIRGMLVECTPMNLRIGDIVSILPARDMPAVTAEVIALQNDHVLLMPHQGTEGLCLACEVVEKSDGNAVAVGDALLGRVVDAAGRALDGYAEPVCTHTVPRLPPPLNPLHRDAIRTPLATGVRAVDVFAPLGRGQRIGIFSGSGVGKSTLLGMICRHSEADVVVVALIGERGREVADFVTEQKQSGAMKRTVVVAASADQSAVMRRQAAWTATAIAEHFRRSGQHVLLIMDSLTRFAHAQREIGLASGEPMASRGYPPSVFGLIPQLLERAGNLQGAGSITGIYTVLVEGDDLNEPVSDALRATLDGHVVLDRTLASKGHYPAIDVLPSISRLSNRLQSAEQRQVVERLRRHLAIYKQSQDLIDLGAYNKGANPELDAAIALKPRIDALLRQAPDDRATGEQTWRAARELTQTGNAPWHDAITEKPRV